MRPHFPLGSLVLKMHAGERSQISSNATPSNSIAARHAKKNVAAHEPRFSMAVIEFSVSPLKPCSFSHFASSL
jgi:hypothetical protein